MSNSKHPLTDAFNMNPEDIDSEYINEVNIPEEAELEDVMKMALKVYKEIMDDLQFIEVKHKPRHYEIAERYLNQAKDAMYKKEQLKLSREKFEKQKGNNVKQNSGSEEENGEEGDSETVSRKELLAEVSQSKRVSNEN